MIFQSLESLNDLRKFVDAHSANWYARDTHFHFRNIVFLTGPVGAGKSFAADYVTNKLRGFNKVETVSLSDFAKLIDGDVIVDCDAIKREINSVLADFGFVCAVVEGACNNLEEVLSTLGDIQADAIQLVCVRPHRRLFKWNNGLKASVLSSKNMDLCEDCLYYANMSEDRLESEIGLITSNYLSVLIRYQDILHASVTTVRNNRIRAMHSGDGWHRALISAKYFNWTEVAMFLRKTITFFRQVNVLFKI